MSTKTVAAWDNKNALGGAGNTTRGLTRSLDVTKEGLAMQATRVCSIEGCETAGKMRRGWCEKHYCRWAATGDPLKTKYPPVDERFWAKVVPTGFCWLFEGSLTPRGYGTFSASGRVKTPAHRWAYEALVGKIPDGLELDHLCRVHNCVNPDHLEPVTHAENIRRAYALILGTSCRNGHPREGNTRRNRNGDLECIPCLKASSARLVAKRSAARRANHLPPERQP